MIDLLDTLHFDDLDSETQDSVRTAITAARAEGGRVAFTHRNVEVYAYPVYRYGTEIVECAWGINSSTSGRCIARGTRS